MAALNVFRNISNAAVFPPCFNCLQVQYPESSFSNCNHKAVGFTGLWYSSSSHFSSETFPGPPMCEDPVWSQRTWKQVDKHPPSQVASGTSDWRVIVTCSPKLGSLMELLRPELWPHFLLRYQAGCISGFSSLPL